MDNFENNWRRQQELKSRPLIDDIYRRVFGNSISITRYEKTDDYLLDKEFAIDVKVTQSNGLILTGQEKALSNKYKSFESLTIEYMQNPLTEEHGDWFKMAVQMYFTGYLNKDSTGFDLWIIANWTQIVTETLAGNIEWKHNSNLNGGARATFKYCNMTTLPTNCIISSSWEDF